MYIYIAWMKYAWHKWFFFFCKIGFITAGIEDPERYFGRIRIQLLEKCTDSLYQEPEAGSGFFVKLEFWPKFTFYFKSLIKVLMLKKLFIYWLLLFTPWSDFFSSRDPGRSTRIRNSDDIFYFFYSLYNVQLRKFAQRRRLHLSDRKNTFYLF